MLLRSIEGTTQGDNLAMAFYALGTKPLQDILKEISPVTKQVWLADDATGAASLTNLKMWWDTIILEGPKFGYHVNESKSWLIIKDNNKLDYAKEMFYDTSIRYTTEGKRHLGAAIGSDDFRTVYATEKIKEWCNEMEILSEYAKSQPQSAYAAFIYGEQHRFSYFLRTIPGMEKYLEPLDKVINEKFLPALFGTPISPIDRELFSLPIRAGGLGIPIYTEKASSDFEASMKITAPLVTIMILQENMLPEGKDVKRSKSEALSSRANNLAEKTKRIEQSLPDNTLRAVNHAKKKGASNWLSTLPLEEQGFTLTKNEFRDALALRYSKNIRGLPSKCPCGQSFNVNHGLNCKRGGFVIMRHNNIRDFEANLMRKVCNDVETEPSLQPINGENVTGLTGDEAKPDVRARGVWRPGQNAFFDIRVTNTNSDSQVHLSPDKIFRKHELEKKRNYNQRIMNIEQGTFTPLIFSINGGEGAESLAFHRHIAEKIAQKTEDRFEHVITWIRTKLSFLILRAGLMCIRGSRNHFVKNQSNVVDDFRISCDDARIS